MRTCVQTEAQNASASQKTLSSRPAKVAVVVAITDDRLDPSKGTIRDRETQLTHANLRCWTRRHGYHFLEFVIPSAEVKHGRTFFDARLRAISRQLLSPRHPSNYTHVLFADSDSIVPNLSKPLPPAMLHAHAPAVQLHKRLNGEVTAAGWFVRTTRSHCR